MRVFLSQTGTPKELLENFNNDLLGFLYYQEDRTEYKVKTISYLIDEIQNLTKEKDKFSIEYLSKIGKRRYNTILNQLNYLCKNGF